MSNTCCITGRALFFRRPGSNYRSEEETTSPRPLQASLSLPGARVLASPGAGAASPQQQLQRRPRSVRESEPRAPVSNAEFLPRSSQERLFVGRHVTTGRASPPPTVAAQSVGSSFRDQTRVTLFITMETSQSRNVSVPKVAFSCSLFRSFLQGCASFLSPDSCTLSTLYKHVVHEVL